MIPRPHSASEYRNLAALFLSRLGRDAIPAMPELLSVATNDIGPGEWAIEALGSIGPPASNAIPVLEVLVTNSSPIIARSAREALPKIRGLVPANQPTIP
jgi:hypothetical protein